MPRELRPLRRRLRLSKTGAGYVGRIGDRAVIAVVTGVGTARAHAATARLLDGGDVDWVIVVGIAGTIDDTTAIGTLVLPAVVVDGADASEHRPTPLHIGNAHGALWTADELIVEPAAHADLRSRGVVALDMETAAVAKVCEERGVAWSVVRAISDRASVDADIAGLIYPDGTVNLAAVAGFLVSRAGALPRLIRLGRDATLATKRAAEAAIGAMKSLD